MGVGKGEGIEIQGCVDRATPEYCLTEGHAIWLHNSQTPHSFLVVFVCYQL